MSLRGSSSTRRVGGKNSAKSVVSILGRSSVNDTAAKMHILFLMRWTIAARVPRCRSARWLRALFQQGVDLRKPRQPSTRRHEPGVFFPYGSNKRRWSLRVNSPASQAALAPFSPLFTRTIWVSSCRVVGKTVQAFITQQLQRQIVKELNIHWLWLAVQTSVPRIAAMHPPPV